jgi:hypothetical protein
MHEQQAPEVFDTIEDVRRFLDAEGYVITKSSISRHKLAGKIQPSADGVYTLAAALKYAKAFLKEKTTGLRKSEGAALQQRQLLDARAELIREQALLAKRKREVEEGKYVLRSAVSQDMAARAVAFKTGLKQLVANNVLDWIHLVAGDPRRAAELQRNVLELIERQLSKYAHAESIVLQFEDESEAPDDAEISFEEEAGNPVA